MSTCIVCHNDNSSIRETFGRFSIWECQACGLQFADPLEYCAEDYDSAYRDPGATGQPAEVYVPTLRWIREASADFHESGLFLSSAQSMALAWMTKNLAAGAVVLDCGCGSGWFLGAARRCGFQVLGVEVGQEPVRILREKGFEVIQGSLEQIPRGWPAPDVVTLFEVLEHLPGPVAFLQRLHGRFPRAPLVLSVPSPRRWTKLGSRRDPAAFPPNHLTHWSEQSLRLAMAQAGYNRITVLSSLPTSPEIAQAGIRALLRCWVAGRSLDRLSEVVSRYPPTRSLRTELKVRRIKRVLGVMPSLAFRLLGWSGFSLLVIAAGDGY